MTYRRIEGEGLRTTFAFAPRFSASTTRDGPTCVSLSFASSPVRSDGQTFRITELTCRHVVEYVWNNFEFHRLPSNSRDLEFGLIEIVDSQLISEIMETGRYTGDPLNHLRISFDDHGTYDIVCEAYEIRHRESASDEDWP